MKTMMTAVGRALGIANPKHDRPVGKMAKRRRRVTSEYRGTGGARGIVRGFAPRWV